MNILYFHKPKQTKFYSQKKRPFVVDLSIKKYNPAETFDFFKEDKPTPKTKSLNDYRHEEEVGRQVILYGSYILTFCLILGFIISYQIITPKWTQAYVAESKSQCDEVERTLEKLKSNVYNNFHEGILIETDGMTDNNEYIINESQKIASELENLSDKTCDLKPKVNFLANDVYNKVQKYCSQTRALSQSYQELLEYYTDMLVIRSEMWDIFEDIPTLDDSNSEALKASMNKYQEVALEFETLKSKFNALEDSYDTKGTNEINISFSQGWADDMYTTASVIDAMNKAQQRGDSDKLEDTNGQIQDLTQNFDSRILEFEEENNLNEKLIRDYYVENIDEILAIGEELNDLFKNYEK